MPWGHTHKTQEEVFLVLDGNLASRCGDEIHELGPWDAIRVHKDTPRGFEAGPEGVEMIAIGCSGRPGRRGTVSRTAGTSREPAVDAPPVVVVVGAEPAA